MSCKHKPRLQPLACAKTRQNINLFVHSTHALGEKDAGDGVRPAFLSDACGRVGCDEKNLTSGGPMPPSTLTATDERLASPELLARVRSALAALGILLA